MNKHVLIINSSAEKNSLLEDLFNELETKNYKFSLWSSNQELLGDYRRQKRRAQKFYFGPKIFGKISSFYFLVSSPALLIYHLTRLFYFKYKYNLSAIILFNFNEKILLTSTAKILKIKIIWLESPEISYRFLPKVIKLLYKFLARNAKLVILAEATRAKLVSLGVKEENIILISPGIRLNRPRHQDNIFSNLVKAERANLNRRYFTIGVVAQYDEPNQIENLFRAIQNCRPIISNLQIVILGDGEAKKQLVWAAKKMEIENIVWFVGRQDNLRKWLEGFDIYVAVNEALNPVAIKVLLKAMEAGLPTIGFGGHGWSDFIKHEETGLLSEPGDSETLASHIIKYYKNRLYLHKLGQNGKRLAEDKFDLTKQVLEFEKIIK